MKIYGFPLSPFVRKVLVAAAEKGLEVDNVLVNPREPSPEFLEASPFRKIPALRDGDFTLPDSTAIVTYLEAKYPEPPLLPAEPRARGRAIWFEEFADTIMVTAGAKIVVNRFVGPKLLGLEGNEDAAQQGEQELGPILDYLDGQAPGESWLAGDMFSIADIAVASTLATLGYVDWGPDATKHARTAAWFARVTTRPAWQAVVNREKTLLEERMSKVPA